MSQQSENNPFEEPRVEDEVSPVNDNSPGTGKKKKDKKEKKGDKEPKEKKEKKDKSEKKEKKSKKNKNPDGEDSPSGENEDLDGSSPLLASPDSAASSAANGAGDASPVTQVDNSTAILPGVVEQQNGEVVDLSDSEDGLEVAEGDYQQVLTESQKQQQASAEDPVTVVGTPVNHQNIEDERPLLDQATPKTLAGAAPISPKSYPASPYRTPSPYTQQYSQQHLRDSPPYKPPSPPKAMLLEDPSLSPPPFPPPAAPEKTTNQPKNNGEMTCLQSLWLTFQKNFHILRILLWKNYVILFRNQATRFWKRALLPMVLFVIPFSLLTIIRFLERIAEYDSAHSGGKRGAWFSTPLTFNLNEYFPVWSPGSRHTIASLNGMSGAESGERALRGDLSLDVQFFARMDFFTYIWEAVLTVLFPFLGLTPVRNK